MKYGLVVCLPILLALQSWPICPKFPSLQVLCTAKKNTWRTSNLSEAPGSGYTRQPVMETTHSNVSLLADQTQEPCCTKTPVAYGTHLFMDPHCTWIPVVHGFQLCMDGSQLYMDPSCTWIPVVHGPQLYVVPRSTGIPVVQGPQLYRDPNCTGTPVVQGSQLYRDPSCTRITVAQQP